jgi:hypothetical protein
MNNKLNNKT